MNKFLMAAVLSGFTLVAQDQLQQARPDRGTRPAAIKKDPQQGRNEETTQIVTNTAKGSPAVNYKGSNNIDHDLQQRVKVALSTGSVGTQGVIASDQLTGIDVQVTNRVVTLSGNVASDKSKQTIGKRVAGLDGVKGVNNNLSVGGQNKTTKHGDLFQPDGYSPGGKDARTEDGRRAQETKKK